MKVAIFIKNNELTALHEEKIRVVIFNMENDKVVGVENITLEEQYKDSIVNWLSNKSINQVYLSEIDEQTHQKISLKGIRVKTDETLKNDKLYNSLALSSLSSNKTKEYYCAIYICRYLFSLSGLS